MQFLLSTLPIDIFLKAARQRPRSRLEWISCIRWMLTSAFHKKKLWNFVFESNRSLIDKAYLFLEGKILVHIVQNLLCMASFKLS